jgi:hypothetical protein
MRAWLGALLLWTLGAGPLLAKEEELHASPGGLAIGMLENAGADDLFEVLPSSQIAVRHLGSGLTCHFELEGNGRVIVFPGLPRGDDVGCDQSSGGVSITFYATRYPEPTTLDELAAGAAEAIRMRFTDAALYEPVPAAEATPSPVPLPQSRSARFLIHLDNGAPMFTRVSVALINGWAIKMRITMPGRGEDAMKAADQRADGEWRALMEELLAIPNL